jgi:hypothetical protein
MISTKNYTVYEPNSVYELMKTNCNININDTIEYISNNQLGYVKYKVLLDENKNKILKIIDDYDLITMRLHTW